MKITITKSFFRLFFIGISILNGYAQTAFDPAKCYQIINKATNKSLQVKDASQTDGAQIFQWTTTANKINQLWQIKSVANGRYNIVSKNGGSLIDAPDCTEGAVIKQFNADGTNSQNWSLAVQTDGSFKVFNQSCNRYFGVLTGSPNDGANVGLKTDASAESFSWFFKEVPCPAPPSPVNLDPTKCYRITNNTFGRVLDVKGVSQANGALIIQNDFNGGMNQLWQVKKLSDGRYNIFSKSSGKVLDVDNSNGCRDGIQVIQFETDGTNSQKWRIESIDDGFGSVKIINESCNKTLKGGRAIEGVPVEISTIDETDPAFANQWRFQEVSCLSTCIATGTIVVERWNNHTNYNFPLVVPSGVASAETTLTTTFPAWGSGDNYFERIRGYIRPRASGNYLFNITSDDMAEFFLSPNKNPSNKFRRAYNQSWTQIDENNKFPSQTSSVIALQVNELYYFEVLHKEGISNDGWRLSWKTEGFPTWQPIFGNLLLRPCDNIFQGLTTTQVFTFEAQAVEGRAKLQWVTNTGFNNDYFNIERLNPQGDFETLDKQNAYTGMEGLKSYTFTDDNPLEGDNFYRINTVSNTGTPQYSEVKKVIFVKTDGVGIFPNPADEYIDIDLRKYEGKTVNIYLYNAMGVALKKLTIEKATSAPQRLDIQEIKTGSYLIRIQAEGKRDVTRLCNITK
jgi:hypothetical protein